MYQLCPSILSADFNRLGEQIKILEKEGIEWHYTGMISRCICSQSLF